MHSEQERDATEMTPGVGLNPLESGHAFRDGWTKSYEIEAEIVLIPSNRVMHSEADDYIALLEGMLES